MTTLVTNPREAQPRSQDEQNGVGGEPRERPCGIAQPDYIVISADGYLYPCLLYRFHGWNLRKIPFREAYRRRHELIPEVIQATNAHLAPCPDCEQSGHYHHCFATAMRVTGDPLAHIPVNHRIAQATARAYAQVQQERQEQQPSPTGQPAGVPA